ncbi:twin-arginine translocase TatA/TatE family subunit [Streptomyces sp. NPDC000348]|uniref:twin-arginine translocase TatA/TatE family subunit n=1 Tax=Streptomyces sp. NPDC000348 TaxID=3364538 RepID=UPI0036A2B1D2
MFGLSELAVVLIVVTAVLAAKKLPDLARSAGKSARILKAEARAVKEQDDAGDAGAAPRIIQGEVQRPSAPASGRTGGTPPSDGPAR